MQDRDFGRVTLFDPADSADELTSQVKEDFKGKRSILELLSQYMHELRGDSDNNAPALNKLAKLFDLGDDLDKLEGFHFGVTLCMRTGDQDGSLAKLGNVIGQLWSSTLVDQSPWKGKSFTRADQTELESIMGAEGASDKQAFLGINYFNKIEARFLNRVSFNLLDWWMDLETGAEKEKTEFHFEKKGGHFVASKTDSVYHKCDRKVFQLNYRWKHLNNRMPLNWLIDEMVKISEGLYLGQLLFATKRLTRGYDPNRPESDNNYQHFGYFILFDSSWHEEARRTFPALDIPTP